MLKKSVSGSSDTPKPLPRNHTSTFLLQCSPKFTLKIGFYRAAKNSWQENFRFHLASEKSEKIRDSFPTVWLKVLKKFRRAPLEMCQAIASLYASPYALISVRIFILIMQNYK